MRTATLAALKQQNKHKQNTLDLLRWRKEKKRNIKK